MNDDFNNRGVDNDFFYHSNHHDNFKAEGHKNRVLQLEMEIAKTTDDQQMEKLQQLLDKEMANHKKESLIGMAFIGVFIVISIIVISQMMSNF